MNRWPLDAIIMATEAELDFSAIFPDCRKDDEGKAMVWEGKGKRIVVTYNPREGSEVNDFNRNKPWVMNLERIRKNGCNSGELRRYSSEDIEEATLNEVRWYCSDGVVYS